MIYEIIKTKDGSDTLMIKERRIAFHSTFGAIQESTHVFVETAFDYYRNKNESTTIQILEIGFGTGLNALLTGLRATQLAQVVNYVSVDAHPVPLKILGQLNYGEQTKNSAFYNRIINSEWNKAAAITPEFNLKKISTRFEDFAPQQLFDACYFDAFAPDDQPELWTASIFKKLYNLLCTGAVLSTYCSKSIVRKNLQAAGFRVDKLKGPPGKREIIRAVK